jgi:chromosome segregation ATPase
MTPELHDFPLAPVDTDVEPGLDLVSDLISRLREEVDRLREEVSAVRKHTAEVSAELSIKESELENLNGKIAAMLEDPAAELATIMRHRGLVLELSAYIKGLRYLSEQ